MKWFLKVQPQKINQQWLEILLHFLFWHNLTETTAFLVTDSYSNSTKMDDTNYPPRNDKQHDQDFMTQLISTISPGDRNSQSELEYLVTH